MWLLILLSFGSAVGAQQDYTRNSVYHKFAPTYPSVLQTTEHTSEDVLKELGVDLSNEGKNHFYFVSEAQKFKNYFFGVFLWFFL